MNDRLYDSDFVVLLDMVLTQISQYLFSSLSDDEERSSLFGQSEVDGALVDDSDKPAESRIKNL